jgi:hypothetical protein
MMEATEDHLTHDDVTVLQLDAPESRRLTHDGPIKVFRALDRLAAMYENGRRLADLTGLNWVAPARRYVGPV